jgi:hypothetical protein
MHPDTLPFLEALFANCQQSYLTLTAIHPDGNHPTPSRHLPLGNTAALHEALLCLFAANHLGWGAYFSVATRRHDLGRWRRGRREDLGELPALFVDIDDPSPDVERRLWQFIPTPSAIVQSSFLRRHCYWLLDHPTSIFPHAESILRGLAAHLNGDLHLSAANSMRLVGSVNSKLSRQGAICQLLDFHPERRYALSDFDAYRQNKPSHTTIWKRALNVANQSAMEMIHDLVRLFSAQGYRQRGDWLNGPCIYPERHKCADRHVSFGFNIVSGYGHCFVCGTMPPTEVGTVVGVVPYTAGW